MSSTFISDSRLERAALRVLGKYETTHAKISAPPVPIERILEVSLELDILWDSITEQPGETILAGLDPDKHRVVFNGTRRQVFDDTPGLYFTVLGHESGHWDVHVEKAMLGQRPLEGFAGEYSCLYKSVGPGQGPKETQANKFMGFLLLPGHLLIPATKDIDLMAWPNLYSLRDRFQVTISALKIRLEQLNLIYVGPDGKLYPSRQEYAGQQRLSP